MGKAIDKAKEIAAENQQQEQPEQQEAVHAATLDELESMDMDALYDYGDGEAPAWRIADDGCADWAVRKIAEERAELERIKKLADEQINRIMEKVTAAERRCQNGTAYLTGKLAEYFDMVPHKKTKTTESYRLLNGTLKMKLGSTTMNHDDAVLLEYLKASGNEDMIKVTEAPKWGEYKKSLQIVGGSVVDSTTGEIVPGVEIVQKPDSFVVEV